MSNAAVSQPDDFAIPPPTENDTVPAEADGFGNEAFTGTPPDSPVEKSVGQTELILGAAGVIVLAGLLMFLRNAIRRSLIASRATIDSAGAAAWTWYFALLVTGALVIAGIFGGLFGSSNYIMVTVAVAVVGLGFALVMHAKAKRTA